MSEKVRWRGGYEKKARQEEGEMSDIKELIEFLDDWHESIDDSVKTGGFLSIKVSEGWLTILTEIKKTLIEHYDLIERLRNINFPIEAKRKK